MRSALLGMCVLFCCKHHAVTAPLCTLQMLLGAFYCCYGIAVNGLNYVDGSLCSMKHERLYTSLVRIRIECSLFLWLTASYWSFLVLIFVVCIMQCYVLGTWLHINNKYMCVGINLYRFILGHGKAEVLSPVQLFWCYNSLMKFYPQC